MKADPEYLRRHYASLSDEALLDIDRAHLVGAAQKCYDAEVEERKLARTVRQADRSRAVAEAGEDAIGEDGWADDAETGEAPDWLDEAAEVYSAAYREAAPPADSLLNAREALKAAGIPAYMEPVETHEETAPHPPATHRWRLVVPGHLGLQALSTLERDLENEPFEANWREQLESASDDELLEMSPDVVFCGLFDRIDRITKAYEEEMARRGLDGE